MEKIEERTWTNDDKNGYVVKSPPKEDDPIQNLLLDEEIYKKEETKNNKNIKDNK